MNATEKFASKIIEWRDSPTLMVKELFNVRPEPPQEEALETYGKVPRLAMISNKGAGKAQPKYIELWTPEGPRLFGDLEAGDEVFAEDGSPTIITAIHQRGVRAIYRVTFDDGSSTEVCGEHLWKVQGRTERQKELGWSIVSTYDILRRGVTVPNGQWRQKQFIIPLQGAIQFPWAVLPVDAYLLGVWIGDGDRGRPYYSKPYEEVEQEINRRGYITERFYPADRCVRVKVAGASFNRVEGYDRNSPDRFIPLAYKCASTEQRFDLLCGLMDTDGSIGVNGYMEFVTTSQQLAEDVVWLVRSLGGNALIKEAIKSGWCRDEDGEKVECRDCWRVTLRTLKNPFRIPYKAERWIDPMTSPSTERYITRFIAKIEPVGEADCMCIEVAHPSHCYLTNDFIVTHNTSTLSWIAWNFLLTRPYPKIAATSISGDQLHDVFWTEMSKWQSKSDILSAMFEWTKTRIFSKEKPNNWWMSARTWPKTGSAEEQANTLAGLHDDYIMFLLDESGAIPDSVAVAAEAALTGGPVEAHIIQAGNPTNLSGPLYRAAMNPDRWYVIRITGDPDNPKRSARMSIEYARDQIKQYGRNHPYVLVNVFGEFPPASLNALIGPDEVRAAMGRYYRDYEIGRSPRIIGVDISRYGDDESVLAFREGFQAYKFRAFRNINGEEGASIVNQECARWEPDAVFLDGTGGWGSSWEDNLRRLGRSPVSIQFNAKAHETLKFENKRAEMYWRMCEWIRRGGALPPDNDFLLELTETTYSIPKDVIILEPKKDLKARILRSPDRADALALTFAEEVSVQRTTRAVNRMRVDYDPFAGLNEGFDGDRGKTYTSNYDPYGG